MQTKSEDVPDIIFATSFFMDSPCFGYTNANLQFLNSENSGITFDHNGDDTKLGIIRVALSDGMLVCDRNNNGFTPVAQL